MPSMVKPVTQEIPLNAPRTVTIPIAITKFGISARRTRNTPAVVSDAPNSLRRENCANIFGPNAIPIARPVNTDPKRTPYAASPPPRSPTNVRARPITAPAAANAPIIPMMSPRIIFESFTDFQPCKSEEPNPASLEAFDAAPFGSSRSPHTVHAANAKLAAFT